MTAEQKQLWQDAADRGDTPGLQRVPVFEDPVLQRARSQAPAAQSKPAPAPQLTIPQGVRNEIRILVYPNDPFASYTGPAQVASVDKTGERIELTLPGKLGTLTLLVRVDTKQLSLMAGDMVDVAYRARRRPQVPDDVIAIRTTGGGGIAHVMQGGNVPVQNIAIPLFNFTVGQRDEPGLPVQISGPNLKPMDLAMGQVSPVGSGVMVRIVGSTGVQQGTNAGQIEGARFTVNVMVWRVP
ncbi:MAG: hypothetical protein ACRD3G_01165 [Vicinamibacterales bacterium]